MCVRVCGRWSDQNILGARVAVILWGTGGNMRAGGYRRCGWGEIARVEMRRGGEREPGETGRD